MVSGWSLNDNRFKPRTGMGLVLYFERLVRIGDIIKMKKYFLGDSAANVTTVPGMQKEGG